MFFCGGVSGVNLGKSVRPYLVDSFFVIVGVRICCGCRVLVCLNMFYHPPWNFL